MYSLIQCQVCRDPRWGRCYESYSEDPEVVRSMTTIIDGLQGKAPEGWTGPYIENRYNNLVINVGSSLVRTSENKHVHVIQGSVLEELKCTTWLQQ